MPSRQPTRRRSSSPGSIVRGIGRPAPTAPPPKPPRHSLPHPVSRFVGRTRQLAELTHLLTETRLLTLIGPGGTGKTRLALQTAHGAVDRFPDGVWWIDLAPLSDATLVPHTVALAFNVREQPGKPIATTLAEHLLDRHLLLVLDNCEHLITAAAELVERLLRTCPGLHILATSREPLAVPGEITFAVPPLSAPDPRLPYPLAELAAFESVQLLVERAREATWGFALTEANAEAVSALCHSLDGLPLAIELAAARLRALSVEEVARRMDRRLQLLAGGSRTALPRHQTLRASMDWSHDLLSELERVLFRRMSVFAGGCSLQAIETICADETAPVTVDLLTQLVGKSLVVVDADSARYRMLETVREYALERLLATGETERIRGQHRDFYLALAERAEPELRGPEQQIWHRRLETERDNLRGAMEWSLSSENAGALLRLAGALWRFWNVRGPWHEGQQWLERALAMDQEAAPAAARAKAAFGAGVLAWWRDDDARASQLLEESRRLAEQLGDRRLAADVIRQMAVVASSRAEHDQARHLAETSLRLFEELDDRWGIAAASRLLGFRAAGSVGYHRSDRIDLDAGTRFLERSLALARELNDRRGIAWSLVGLGTILWQQGDWRKAAAICEEVLALFREVGDRAGIGETLMSLARAYGAGGELARAQTLAAEGVAVAEEVGNPFLLALLFIVQARLAVDLGDVAGAEGLFRQALQLMHRTRNIGGMADCLDGLARASGARRKWKRAAALQGAAAALRKSSRTMIPDLLQLELNRLSTIVRAALGESAYARARDAAASMELHEIVSFALADVSQARAVADAGEPAEGLLTDRERQVAALVAQGSSNREIAGTFFLSERTVESHVQHILNKLDFRSRTQIAVWAVANRLE